VVHRGQLSELLTEGRTVEFIGALSELVRRYLGRRYGFDGMELVTPLEVDLAEVLD
jgi:hypothetical protein